MRTLEDKVAVVTGRIFGRAIAALAAGPNVIRHTGTVLVAARLALEYGFTDIDGKVPRALTPADV